MISPETLTSPYSTADPDDGPLVVPDGYVVECLAGVGGLGRVFKAHDRDGQSVAIKLLVRHDAGSVARFARECAVLRTVQHPAIVGYICDGRLASGEPYLIMEWLEGVELRALLEERRLSVRETLELGIRMAQALCAVHQQHLVHRDIKPANIFLPAGDLARAKLIDFGVVHRRQNDTQLTSAGQIVGTPAYMSPEQVRGLHGIGPGSDVYSLGCVLFECLTGDPPFAGDHPMAVLCKTLLEDVPRVADVASGIPAVMDELLQHLLHKDVDRRPRDAQSALHEIRSVRQHLESRSELRQRVAAPGAQVLTCDEQRLVNVLVMAPDMARPSVARVADAELATIHGISWPAALAAGARLESLRDGTLVAVFEGRGVAMDQAGQAAQLALAWRRDHPDVAMILATGRALLGRKRLVGEVIDRAVGLLTEEVYKGSDPATHEGGVASGARPIRTDALTTALLCTRFHVGTVHGKSLIWNVRSARDDAPSNEGLDFVGRERELSLLVAALHECVGDDAPQTLLLVGEPGLGKTRLFHEFAERARREHHDVDIWLARGDPGTVHSPFSTLAELLSVAVGMRAGDPLATRRRALEAYLGDALPADHLESASAFLGELLHTPLLPEDHAELRAARQSPRLMTQGIRDACVRLVAMRVRRHPLIIALDDVQWIDSATLNMVDALLHGILESPLMVVGMGRQELHDHAPGLWQRHGRIELRLGGLGRHAARRLVSTALDCAGDDPRVAELVAHGRGNPFHLRELVHSQRSGRRYFPETALALVQARIDALDGATRRILRAASIFGQVFWRGAIAALVGDERSVDASLDELCHSDMFALRTSSRFPGEIEYEFHHGLIREGAYAMLTANDLRLGHRLAGSWLAEQGESNAQVLAEHFEKGGLMERAVSCYLRAAEHALEAGDLDEALLLAERGEACGATLETLGLLYSVRINVFRWRGDNGETAELCHRALGLLRRGSRRWFEVAGEAAAAWGRIGMWDRVAAMAENLATGFAAEHDVEGWLMAAAQVASQLIVDRQSEPGFALLRRAEERAATMARVPPLAAGNLYLAQATRMLVSPHGPGAMLEVLERCATSFEAAGDMRQACLSRSNVGYAKMEIGLYREAVEDLRAALYMSRRMDLERAAYSACNNLGMALARCGELDSALAMEEAAACWFASVDETRLLAGCRIYLAKIHLLSDDPQAAEREACAACAILAERSSLRPHALAVLARAELERGAVAQALVHARAAFELLTELASVEEGESEIRLVHAMALDAAGEHQAARQAIATARDRLMDLARAIDNPTWRASFLGNMSEHVETLELAERWHA